MSDDSDDILLYLIEQGVDWNEQLQLENCDGTPDTLLGATVQLDIFQSAQNPALLLSLSSGAGTMTLNGATAQINWVIPAAQTSQLQPTPGILDPGFGIDPLIKHFGFYVLRARFADGQIFKELSGPVALKLGPPNPFQN